MNKILPIILVVVLFFPELSFAIPIEPDAWEPRSGGGSRIPWGALFAIFVIGFLVVVIFGLVKVIGEEPNPVESIIWLIGFFVFVYYGLSYLVEHQ